MDETPEKPHRGINMSRIPAAGLPGLVFALAIVWMFWSGAPTYRPLLIIAGSLGLLAGGLLVAWRVRHIRSASRPILHLRDPHEPGKDR